MIVASRWSHIDLLVFFFKQKTTDIKSQPSIPYEQWFWKETNFQMHGSCTVEFPGGIQSRKSHVHTKFDIALEKDIFLLRNPWRTPCWIGWGNSSLATPSTLRTRRPWRGWWSARLLVGTTHIYTVVSHRTWISFKDSVEKDIPSFGKHHFYFPANKLWEASHMVLFGNASQHNAR